MKPFKNPNRVQRIFLRCKSADKTDNLCFFAATEFISDICSDSLVKSEFLYTNGVSDNCKSCIAPHPFACFLSTCRVERRYRPQLIYVTTVHHPPDEPYGIRIVRMNYRFNTNRSSSLKRNHSRGRKHMDMNASIFLHNLTKFFLC